MAKSRLLWTGLPVPVDPSFVRKFMEGGYPRVSRIYGKRRTDTWMKVLGRHQMTNKRREHLASLRAANRAQARA
jgi:hypothetical protein